MSNHTVAVGYDEEINQLTCMKVERLEIGEMKNWRKEKVDIFGFLRCSPKANHFAKREGLKNEEGQQYLTFFQLTAN